MTVIGIFRTGNLALVSDPGPSEAPRAVSCVAVRAAGWVTVEVAGR